MGLPARKLIYSERSIHVHGECNKCHKGIMMQVQVGPLWTQRRDMAIITPSPRVF